MELSGKDYDVFKEGMDELEENLKAVEYFVNKYDDLRKELGETWSKNVMRELEGKIKEEPLRMIEQSDYMNHYVPKMRSVMEAYARVKERRILSEEEEDFLKEAENSVEFLGEKVNESYIKYNKPEVDKLKDFNKLLGSYISKGEAK